MSLYVKVTFSTNSYKFYTYIYDGEKPVEEGDLAVVNSPYGGYQLVTVREVGKRTDYDGSLKKIIEIISLAAERREKQTEAERVKIKRKLDRLAAKQTDLMKYEIVAQHSLEARQLLNELKALG